MGKAVACMRRGPHAMSTGRKAERPWLVCAAARMNGGREVEMAQRGRVVHVLR